MVRVDGSRRVTLRNRRFVRPLKTGLKTTSHQAPARRKPLPPTTRQDQPKETLPSSPRIVVEKEAEVPAEVDEEIIDDQFEEVHDTEDVQDDATTTEQDDKQSERVFEDAPALKDLNEGWTRPRRAPQPNSRYSPEDYDLNYVKARRGARAGLRHEARSCPGGGGGGHN